MWMICYSIGNILASQMWKQKYAPKDYIPWCIQIVFAWFIPACIVLVIRYILLARNKERRKYMEEHPEEGDYGFVDTVDENGNTVREKVDISMLDLTDLENKRFLYPL